MFKQTFPSKPSLLGYSAGIILFCLFSLNCFVCFVCCVWFDCVFLAVICFNFNWHVFQQSLWFCRDVFVIYDCCWFLFVVHACRVFMGLAVRQLHMSISSILFLFLIRFHFRRVRCFFTLLGGLYPLYILR